MTDEQLIDVVKLCIQAQAPILKSDAVGLLSIIDRQASEVERLREIEEAAREYREFGTQQVPPVDDCGESMLTRRARQRLDELLGMGEAK